MLLFNTGLCLYIYNIHIKLVYSGDEKIAVGVIGSDSGDFESEMDPEKWNCYW